MKTIQGKGYADSLDISICPTNLDHEDGSALEPDALVAALRPFLLLSFRLDRRISDLGRKELTR